MYHKDLGSIAEPGGGGDLRIEELGPQHLSALSELNRKRFQGRADKRFAGYLEKGFHGFVAFRGDEAIVMMLGGTTGITPRDRVVGLQTAQTIGVGERMLGRCVNS